MKRLILGGLLLTTVFSAQAKILYVDVASGNDATTYSANGPSSPWRSIGRAVWGSTSMGNPNGSQAAQAGDTVIVRAGVYTATQMTGTRYIPTYNPVNNGSYGNPITISAEGTVTLRSTTTGGSGPIIGAFGKSYIVWDGFYVDEPNIQTTSDTGPVVIWSSNNITLQNLTINGKTSSWNDNHNSIRIEDSRDSLIRNNRIFGNRNAGMNANGSAMMLYTSSNITIEHNEIYNSGGGIFVKGANTGPFNIRYNLIHHIDGGGILIGGVGTNVAQNGARIYQNVIRDNAEGITFIGYDSVSPANIDVVNNTIHNCSNGGIFFKPNTAGYSDIVLRNNIIADSARGIQGEDISDLRAMTFSHNFYHGDTTVSRIAYTNYSFDSWRSNFSKDTAGSRVVDPLFVNRSGDDFRLAAGSPAVNAGLDILNLAGNGTSASITVGAYITGNEVIGPTSQVLTAPPSPPTAVEVVP